MVSRLILAAILVVMVTGVPLPEPNPYRYPYNYPYARAPAARRYPAAPGYRRSPKQPVVYAPIPGEIVFKMLQNWNPELLNSESSEFQIMEGNVRSAVQAVLGPSAQVTNVYFREGYVPGNPPARPKTVAHMMVNGGSDAASLLERSVSLDGSLGDGLKVYKDSFNAY